MQIPGGLNLILQLVYYSVICDWNEMLLTGLWSNWFCRTWESRSSSKEASN